MKALIHNKLIEDIGALEYTGTSNKLFTSVKKFIRDTMTGEQCLILDDGVREEIIGATTTTRTYKFMVVYVDELEKNVSDSEASIVIDRGSNREDVILDYIQKEPGNLNSWADSEGFTIYKMRLAGEVTVIDVLTKSGQGTMKSIPVEVPVLITPQSL